MIVGSCKEATAPFSECNSVELSLYKEIQDVAETELFQSGSAVWTKQKGFEAPWSYIECPTYNYELQGNLAGETSGDINVMSNHSTTVFGDGIGEQNSDVAVFLGSTLVETSHAVVTFSATYYWNTAIEIKT